MPTLDTRHSTLDTPRPVQRSMDLAIPDNRLLVSVATARTFIDRDEQAIIDLIEDGRLQYAWNIAAPGATKREIRIHRDSLRAYQGRFLDARTEDQYLATLFQHSRPNVRLSELYRALNCTHQHAAALLRAGCLTFVPGSTFAPQVGQRLSPLIPRAAVITFLKTRRLP